MSIQDCYDVLDLPLEFKPSADGAGLFPIPEGRYILEVAGIVYEGIEARLFLRLHSKVSRARNVASHRRSERIFVNTTALYDGQNLLLQVPLTSNGSNNLVELDRDLIQGQVWMFEGSGAGDSEH